VLKPGQRLNEFWLARDIGVSRPPLREAIRVLEQEGLIECFPRRGCFVRTLSGQDILEVYTVRYALEALAAELLIDRNDPEAIDELESDLLGVEPDTADLADRIDKDIEFHRALVRLSGNGRLLFMWEQLASQLRLALTLVDPALFQIEFVEATHRPLVHAIRMGDRAGARRFAQTLLSVGEGLKERWETQVFSADEDDANRRTAHVRRAELPS
jgi:DNA-binding GntR family transcriptional regulator